MHARKNLDQARLASSVVTEHACDLSGPHLHGDVLQGDHAAEVLADVPHFEQRAGSSRPHGPPRRALAARLLTRVFTPTATKRITPRNVKYQFESQLAKMMPICAKPMTSAPIDAPIADPYPPVNRQPPTTAAMKQKNSCPTT